MLRQVVAVEAGDAVGSAGAADVTGPPSGRGSPVQQSAFHLQIGQSHRVETGSNGRSQFSQSIT